MRRQPRPEDKRAQPAQVRRLALRLALPATLLVLLLGSLLLRDPAGPSPAAADEGALLPVAGAAGWEEDADLPELVQLPLDRLDRLVPVGAMGACALGGREAVCTLDGGRRWDHTARFPARPLAIVEAEDGGLLVAAEDGSILSLRDGGEPRVERPPMAERSVVDASAWEGALYLLAHGFDSPKDPLRLPRVVETVLLALRPDGALDEVGTSRGFTGDRLLIQPDGTIVTFTSVDPRAWRSTDGGASFRRLPDGTRFGSDYGGLLVAVERWPHRLRGPGRPARPASAVYVSRDGGERWDIVFDTNGEIIVDFKDARVGLIIARDEGTAWLTTDGADGFVPARRDDLLHGTVAITHVGDHFLVATADAQVIRIPADERALDEGSSP